MELTELRKQAETRLKEELTELRQLPADEAKRLLHELRTHQIELEMQNEELRKTQLALKELLDRYIDLYESAPVGYLTLNEDGLILDANTASGHMLNRAVHEMVSHPLSDFIASDDKDILYLLQQRLQTTKQPQSCELRLRVQDGGTRWVKVDCNATKDREGKAMLIRASLDDISKRRQTETLLQEAHDTLEQRVADRTTELEQALVKLDKEIKERKQVEAAEKKHMLETARVTRINTMGEMISEIAHELNQPLAAIAIYSDACMRMVDAGAGKQEKVLNSLNKISDQAQRAGHIITSLRDFIRKNDTNPEQTGINTLLREVMRLAELETRWHEVELRLYMVDPEPAVMADKILVEQVIVNLVRNAIESMESTPVTQRKLTIATEAHEDNAEVWVRDAGCGLHGKDIDNLFDPFITSKPEGLGMGLAICKSIIKAHGGTLWAESNPESGATFHFTLPFIQKDSNE